MRTYEEQILNNTDATNGFLGLPGSASLNAVSDEMVINAGGTTANTGSSVYLMRLGSDDGVCGVYRGGTTPFELGESIVHNMTTDDPLNYPAYYTPGTGWFGLQHGSAYSVSRIVNLTEDEGAGLTDAKIYRAIAAHPAGHEPNLIVMSERSREQLRSSRTAVNAKGIPAPRPQEVSDIEIVTTTALRDDEALLS